MSTQSQPAKHGGARPGAGRPDGSRSVRVVMREKLITAYVDALGAGARDNPIVMEDIHRAADLVLLAREARHGVRQGTVKLADMTRLEGAADRAVRRLNLPEPGRSKTAQRYGRAEPVPTLQDYFANQQGEDE